MKKYIKEYITVFLIFIITAWLGIFQPFYALDHMASDMVYQRASAINKKIKIIKIDEKTTILDNKEVFKQNKINKTLNKINTNEIHFIKTIII